MKRDRPLAGVDYIGVRLRSRSACVPDQPAFQISLRSRSACVPDMSEYCCKDAEGYYYWSETVDAGVVVSHVVKVRRNGCELSKREYRQAIARSLIKPNHHLESDGDSTS
ncbi:MAG: hypothetical protein AB4042_02775 [Leptolyngbyaceae cyanobacterium]